LSKPEDFPVSTDDMPTQVPGFPSWKLNEKMMNYLPKLNG